jgi:hypothetical protein
LFAQHADGRQSLVITDYAFGKYLGILDAVFDDKGDLVSHSGNPWLLSDKTTETYNATPEVRCLCCWWWWWCLFFEVSSGEHGYKILLSVEHCQVCISLYTHFPGVVQLQSWCCLATEPL